MDFDDLIAKILIEIIKRVSPELKKFILDMIRHLEEKAKATNNKWDDVLVAFIKAIFEYYKVNNGVE